LLKSFASQIPADFGEKNTTMVALKTAHNLFGLGAMLCEDITTLGRLNIFDSKWSDKYQITGDLCWLGESILGLGIVFLEIQKQDKAVFEAKQSLVKANQTGISADGRAGLVKQLSKEQLKLHLLHIMLGTS
jgi:hypothetical protein